MNERQIFPQPELLTYQGILDEIANCLHCVQQCLKSEDLLRATEYQIEAKKLIELLEMFNCGSVGGFDIGQPRPKNLLERYNWLVNKNRVYNI